MKNLKSSLLVKLFLENSPITISRVKLISVVFELCNSFFTLINITDDQTVNRRI